MVTLKQKIQTLFPSIPDSDFGVKVVITENDTIGEWNYTDKVCPSNEALSSITTSGFVKSQIARNTAVVQLALDTVAKDKGFKDIISATSFTSLPTEGMTSKLEEYQKIGLTLLLWRAKVWELANEVMATSLSSISTMPSEEQAVAMIPSFVWPDGSTLSSFVYFTEKGTISYTTQL